MTPLAGRAVLGTTSNESYLNPNLYTSVPYTNRISVSANVKKIGSNQFDHASYYRLAVNSQHDFALIVGRKHIQGGEVVIPLEEDKQSSNDQCLVYKQIQVASNLNNLVMVFCPRSALPIENCKGD